MFHRLLDGGARCHCPEAPTPPGTAQGPLCHEAGAAYRVLRAGRASLASPGALWGAESTWLVMAMDSSLRRVSTTCPSLWTHLTSSPLSQIPKYLVCCKIPVFVSHNIIPVKKPSQAGKQVLKLSVLLTIRENSTSNMIQNSGKNPLLSKQHCCAVPVCCEWLLQVCKPQYLKY